MCLTYLGPNSNKYLPMCIFSNFRLEHDKKNIIFKRKLHNIFHVTASPQSHIMLWISIGTVILHVSKIP